MLILQELQIQATTNSWWAFRIWTRPTNMSWPLEDWPVYIVVLVISCRYYIKLLLPGVITVFLNKYDADNGKW